MTSSYRLYVYGVTPADVPAPDRAECVEPSGGPIYKVVHHEVAALVSTFSATRVRPTRANLRAHEGVVEQATRLGMVIPMRFGVLVDNEDELVSQFLLPRLQELRDLLRAYDAHMEMRVEARYRDGVAVREAAADEPRIARLRRRMKGRPPAATYYDRLALGELVAAAIERRTERDARQIGAALASVARRARRLPPGSDDSVFRGAFLVPTSKLGAFDQWLGELAEREAHRMTFEVVGPLAPWDFVDLRVSGPAEPSGDRMTAGAAGP